MKHIQKAVTSPQITAYIRAAMAPAVIKTIDDGSYYANIPSCNGVWANEQKKEACIETLQEVLEEWAVLKLRDNDIFK